MTDEERAMLLRHEERIMSIANEALKIQQTLHQVLRLLKGATAVLETLTDPKEAP